jgi:hypothetical protein
MADAAADEPEMTISKIRMTKEHPMANDPWLIETPAKGARASRPRSGSERSFAEVSISHY